MNHTLCVGIDVAKLSNHVYALNFNRDKLLSVNIPNTQDGANLIETHILKLLDKHHLSKVIVILESTGVYSGHLATYLSASKFLSVFDIRVYLINPKISKNYRKSFADMDKTDPKDAYILAEIVDISQFESNDALAKYAGITWRKNQSGKFTADETYMTKTGNKYLRYFLIQAANMARIHMPEYHDFYQKKYDEVTTHQHKRALALTARKLIRLIYGLLSTNRLYK